jgi:hypothetical protein
MQNSDSNNEVKNQSENASTTVGHDLEQKLKTTGWALFFIWLGIAFLVQMSMGVGLLGVGVIILVMQVVRKHNNLKAEGFWVVIGILFVLAGLWELLQADIPLVPFVLIIAGIVLFLSVLRKKQ